jgi:hypothetical protein
LLDGGGSDFGGGFSRGRVARPASPPGVSLSGTVYDASGAVVPGVLILLKSNTDRQEAARERRG